MPTGKAFLDDPRLLRRHPAMTSFRISQNHKAAYPRYEFGYPLPEDPADLTWAGCRLDERNEEVTHVPQTP